MRQQVHPERPPVASVHRRRTEDSCWVEGRPRVISDCLCCRQEGDQSSYPANASTALAFTSTGATTIPSTSLNNSTATFTVNTQGLFVLAPAHWISSLPTGTLVTWNFTHSDTVTGTTGTSIDYFGRASTERYAVPGDTFTIQLHNTTSSAITLSKPTAFRMLFTPC